MFDGSDTNKLHWETKHVPLSVNVCSTVPGYNQSKCFVLDGDAKKLVKDMLQHLIGISKESYRLVSQNVASIFEANDKKIDPQEHEENEEDL